MCLLAGRSQLASLFSLFFAKSRSTTAFSEANDNQEGLFKSSLPCGIPAHSQTDRGKYYAPIILITTTWNIPPSWNSGSRIPQQSEEEVMTQEGVIAQLAVKTGSRRPKFHMFLLPQHRQQEICFPLTAGMSLNANVFKWF